MPAQVRTPNPVDRQAGSTPKRIEVQVGESFDSNIKSLPSSLGGGYILRLTPNVLGKRRITRPYEESVWVHACLRAGSLAASSPPGNVWDADPSDETLDAQMLPDDHPLVAMIRHPNPMCSEKELWEAGYVNRKSVGEEFWFLTDANGDPLEADSGGKIPYPDLIYSVPGGRNVEMIVDRATRLPTHWATDWGGHRRAFPVHSVVQFRNYDPNNLFRGLGEIEVLAAMLDMEFHAIRYQRGVMGNGGFPAMLVLHKGTLTEPEFDRWQQAMSAAIKNPENARGVKMLDQMQNRELVFSKLSPRDMEYQELLKMVRTATCSITGVPETIIGVYDRATFRNFEQSERIFWRGGNGIKSHLRTNEDVINSKLMPRWQDEPAREYVFEYDTSDVEALQEDESDKFKLAAELVNSVPGMTWHEATMRVGLRVEPIQHGDQGWIKAGVAPIEMAQELASATLSGDVQPNEEPEKQLAVHELLFDARKFKDAESADTWARQRGQDGALSRRNGHIVLRQRGSDLFTEGSLREIEIGEGVTARIGEVRSGVDTRALFAVSKVDDSDGDDNEVVEPSVDSQREAMRSAAWKGLAERLLDPSERRMKPKAVRYQNSFLEAQLRRLSSFARNGKAWGRFRRDCEERGETTIDSYRIAAQIKPKDLEVLLLAEDEWKDKLAKAFDGDLKKAFLDAAKSAATEVGGDPFGASDPDVLRFLSKQKFRMSDNVVGTLREKVRTAILKTLTESDATGSLQEIIAKLLPELKGNLKGAFADKYARATTIARTETSTAVNGARMLTWEKEDIDEHEWLTQRDDNVRDTHEVLDGQVRKVGKKFGNGARYPGDPEVPASERVNERCLTLPVLKEQ